MHSCPIRSARCTSFSDISHILQRMGSRSGLLVPIYPSRCTSPRSSNFELRITIYWTSLEAIVNSIKIILMNFWFNIGPSSFPMGRVLVDEQAEYAFVVLL